MSLVSIPRKSVVVRDENEPTKLIEGRGAVLPEYRMCIKAPCVEKIDPECLGAFKNMMDCEGAYECMMYAATNFQPDLSKILQSKYCMLFSDATDIRQINTFRANSYNILGIASNSVDELIKVLSTLKTGKPCIKKGVEKCYLCQNRGPAPKCYNCTSCKLGGSCEADKCIYIRTAKIILNLTGTCFTTTLDPQSLAALFYNIVLDYEMLIYLC